MKIGHILKKYRLELNLKQEEVAAAAGITQVYLSMIENNHKVPSLLILKKICDELSILISIGDCTLTKKETR